MPNVVRVGNSNHVNQISFLALKAADLLITLSKSVSLSVGSVVRSESQNCPVVDLRWLLMSFNLERPLSCHATMLI